MLLIQEQAMSVLGHIIHHRLLQGPCLEKENLYNMFFIFLNGGCRNICRLTTDDELAGNMYMLMCIMSSC